MRGGARTAFRPFFGQIFSEGYSAMKNDFYRMKRLSVAWIVTGIVFIGALIGFIIYLFRGIFSGIGDNSDPILDMLLFLLIPLGFVILAIAWRLTVKRARTVSSVIFFLFTLAVLALAGLLIFLIMLTLSLHPIESVMPICLLIGLTVWYVLFFILRKNYSHLIGMNEKHDGA